MDSLFMNRGESTRKTTASSTHHNYNYNNLPKFSANNFPNRSFSANSSIANSTITRSPQHKEHLPFYGSRRQMVSDFAAGGSQAKSSANYALNSYQDFSREQQKRPRINSGESILRKFTRGTYVNNERNEGASDKDVDNVAKELVSFLKSLFLLLYLIFNKVGVWILYYLTYTFSVAQALFTEIPNPNWKNLEELHNSESKEIKRPSEEDEGDDTSIIESTGQEIDPTSKYPEFSRRLNQLKQGQLNSELSYKDQKVDRIEETHKTDLSNNNQKFHYGTRFYPVEKKSNVINLENTFLNIASSVIRRSSSFKPVKPYSNVENIKSSIQALTDMDITAAEAPRPSFTRSTARFADLEWLKDDNEDYINNLEYTRLFKEYQRIFEERNKMQELLKIKKLKDEGFSYKPLSENKRKEIESVWGKRPSGTLISKYNIDISIKDLLTLSDGKWLNDNVIDFYLKMIAESVNGINCKAGEQKIHIFSTHFYSSLSKKGYNGVARWAKRAKVDVSKLEYLFVPVNLNQMHWTLAVVDNINRRFIYVDSLYGTGEDILVNLLDYMTQETTRIYGKEMNGKDYTLYDMESEAQGPKQQNGFDCGVFACSAVSSIARHRGFCYTQADMGFLRRRMAFEILKGKLDS